MDFDAVFDMVTEQEAQQFADEYQEWQKGQKENLVNQRKELFDRLEADFK